MAHFVLVHGGMIGGNSWKKVRKILERRHHAVLTPTLTGLGERKHLSHPEIDLETHIQDVLNVIFYEELDEVILAGHSYGGMVIRGIADRIPDKIKKIIYIAAILPKEGESMFDAIGPEVASFLERAAAEGNGWAVPAAPAQSYGITDSEEVRWFTKMSTPHPLKSFQQKLHFQNGPFRGIEEIYVKCSQDPALDSMANRAKEMKMTCYEIQSGHFPMITSPEALADLILK